VLLLIGLCVDEGIMGCYYKNDKYRPQRPLRSSHSLAFESVIFGGKMHNGRVAFVDELPGSNGLVQIVVVQTVSN
jgi:hypothetical protein